MSEKQFDEVTRCPKCSASIDFVIEFGYIPAEWKVCPGKHGGLNFLLLGCYYDDIKEQQFLCPECDEVICTNYGDLKRFFGLEESKEVRIMKVRVPIGELKDIQALEQKFQAKFLQAELGEEEAIVEMLPVASLDFFVYVYNCKATLALLKGVVVLGITKDEWEYDEELYQELIDQVIYEDNDGSITWSGNYWPQSEESLALFREFLKGLKRKA